MKTLKLLIVTSLISSSLLCQERKKEVSFLYGGKYDNQLILKKQSKKNENKFRRISFSNLNSYQLSYDITNFHANFNIGFGYEKRKKLNNKNFTFYKGPEFVTYVSLYAGGDLNTFLIAEKFKYNLGLSYTYKQFILGIENQSFLSVSAIEGFVYDVNVKIFNPYLSLSYKF
jgi:hypothetical protein